MGGGAIDLPPKNFSIPRLRYFNRAVTLTREAAQVQSWIFSSFSYFSNILSAVNINILGLYKQGRPQGGKLGNFAPGPSLKGAPGRAPEYLFKRSIYSNRAVRSKYSNRAVTVFFIGAV